MNWRMLFQLTVGLLVAISPMAGLYAMPGGEEVHTDEPIEWCERHNGDLLNVQAVGDHGGLHCELPNGTVVHPEPEGTEIGGIA